MFFGYIYKLRGVKFQTITVRCASESLKKIWNKITEKTLIADTYLKKLCKVLLSRVLLGKYLKFSQM